MKATKHQEFLTGLIRLHILHHAVEEEIYGHWMIEELARHGYRTELIDSVTEEEPNARVLPWIRQRSRWQKGFAMTWAVHMRAPLTLLRQVGFKRFIGVQALFLG